MIRLALIIMLAANSAIAETVIAARTIPAKSVISASDLVISAENTPGAVLTPTDVIGMEARVALYAGRPIMQADIGFPAVVERNQIISLLYSGSGLMISTEGRALGRAGPGDVVRVMNLNSRTTVMARIGVDGVAHVQR